MNGNGEMPWGPAVMRTPSLHESCNPRMNDSGNSQQFTPCATTFASPPECRCTSRAPPTTSRSHQPEHTPRKIRGTQRGTGKQKRLAASGAATATHLMCLVPCKGMAPYGQPKPRLAWPPQPKVPLPTRPPPSVHQRPPLPPQQLLVSCRAAQWSLPPAPG